MTVDRFRRRLRGSRATRRSRATTAVTTAIRAGSPARGAHRRRATRGRTTTASRHFDAGYRGDARRRGQFARVGHRPHRRVHRRATVSTPPRAEEREALPSPIADTHAARPARRRDHDDPLGDPASARTTAGSSSTSPTSTAGPSSGAASRSIRACTSSGVNWLHKRKSALFCGVGEDAEHVVAQLVGAARRRRRDRRVARGRARPPAPRRTIRRTACPRLSRR